jgi:hypothetical protein
MALDGKALAATCFFVVKKLANGLNQSRIVQPVKSGCRRRAGVFNSKRLRHSLELLIAVGQRHSVQLQEPMTKFRFLANDLNQSFARRSRRFLRKIERSHKPEENNIIEDGPPKPSERLHRLE